jgi:hypothetical protein
VLHAHRSAADRCSRVSAACCTLLGRLSPADRAA